MDTETLTVLQKGEDFEIIVQHDQTGSAYGITLSKNAYEQLRQHFVSGSLPTDEEISKHAKKYDVEDMNDAINRIGGFIVGAKWMRDFIYGNDR